MTCEFYSVCKSQGIGQPGLCVCPKDCVEEIQDVMIVEKDTNKVCGTDGQTYDSECLLKIAACNKQQYIVVANKGECGKCGFFFAFKSALYLPLFDDFVRKRSCVIYVKLLWRTVGRLYKNTPLLMYKYLYLRIISVNFCIPDPR